MLTNLSLFSSITASGIMLFLQVFIDPHVRGAHEQSRLSHMHASASASALPSSSNNVAGFVQMPRSSSGSNMRHSSAYPDSGTPYAHRAVRTNSDAPARSASPAQFAHHQRQLSGGVTGAMRVSSQKGRPTSANINRNNSSRASPNLPQQSHGAGDSMVSPASGRSSPSGGGLRHGNLALDENAPSMLQRMAANWAGERPQQMPRLPYRDERGSPVPGIAPHHGSMSSLPSASGVPYGPKVSHQRNRSGRSLDAADPTGLSQSSREMLGVPSSGGSGRSSPIRRVQTFADKTSAQAAYNGRNSPKMGTAALTGQSASSVRYRQHSSQGQSTPPGHRMSGTSFSSSFH